MALRKTSGSGFGSSISSAVVWASIASSTSSFLSHVVEFLGRPGGITTETLPITQSHEIGCPGNGRASSMSSLYRRGRATTASAIW